MINFPKDTGVKEDHPDRLQKLIGVDLKYYYKAIELKLYEEAINYLHDLITNLPTSSKFIDGTNPLDAVYMGGNVGIGNVAPDQLLVIGDSVINKGRFRFGIISTSDYDVTHSLDNLGYGLGHNASSRNLRLVTGNVNRLTILGTGNVGIGTDAPLAKLDVNGDALINGVKVGLGGGGNTGNLAFGISALRDGTTGNYNVGLGSSALANNETGNFNLAIGTNSILTAIGTSGNTGIGYGALQNITSGNYNLAIGYTAGRYIADGVSPNTNSSSGVFIGVSARPNIIGGSNEIVIGSDSIGNGSNSVTLGNDGITKTILKGNVGLGTTTPTEKLDVVGNAKISGSITGATIVKSGGTSSQLLRADGSVQSNEPTVIVTADTALILTNIFGTYYNMTGAANAASVFTIALSAVGRFCVVRINRATEPTITGATKIKGSTFIANTDMHMWVQYFGGVIQYYFAEL